MNRFITTSALCILFGNVGYEGRVGMAAATVMEGAEFDGSKIYNHVVSYLPSYARPRFIRIQVNMTSYTLYWNTRYIRLKYTGEELILNMPVT